MITLKIDDKQYPKNLRKINNPPKKIYVEGNIQNLDKPGIAVVGSRDCSEYGKRMCKYFTEKLVDYNLNIISGMAVGIDAVAHNTAIDNLGNTVAVLPSGFNKVYPKENLNLYKKIIEAGGTVVSEYQENVEADKSKFVKRNRIVSGLAIGTLVVEGAYRSGSRVTARLAKEQGKPVFCIPNSLENKNYYASNYLIKKGAYLVTSEKDIFNVFQDIKFTKRKLNNEEISQINKLKKQEKNSCSEKNELNIEVSSELLDVYSVLKNEPISINEICILSGNSINDVNYKLTMLEIEGAIKEYPGKMFAKN
jgi:DNA processing protein